jgi:hypothetical protein
MITLAINFFITDDSLMSGWAFRGMAVPKKGAVASALQIFLRKPYSAFS